MEGYWKFPRVVGKGPTARSLKLNWYFKRGGGLKTKILSLLNRTVGRRIRQNACVWQTWQGYNLRVLSWSSLNSNVFWPKYLFNGAWSSAESFFKQNYCHAFHTGFAVFFPLPSFWVSSILSPWRLLHEYFLERPTICSTFLLCYFLYNVGATCLACQVCQPSFKVSACSFYLTVPGGL